MVMMLQLNLGIAIQIKDSNATPAGLVVKSSDSRDVVEVYIAKVPSTDLQLPSHELLKSHRSPVCPVATARGFLAFLQKTLEMGGVGI
mmetsp:Transcript_93932/g.223505  ORF Transcript_93932/g.223505 Transcript_93932/m.223505 type:complete len:88 (-) Transcript_93932:178-441(-)